MYYNGRNNQRYYGFGCSMFSLILGLIIFSMIIRGSLYFFFRYFWLIVALAVVVWVFRKITRKNQPTSRRSDSNPRGGKSNWNRNFENQEDTSFHNLDRDFEEIDEDDDEFDDF